MVLFDDIEHGTEFYFSEEDYITSEELTGNPSSNRGRSRKSIVKMECTIRSEIPFDPLPGPSSSKPRISPRGKRRPRRSAAASVKSYVVPDSDDEEIAGGKSDDHVKKRRVESNLQRWIKHLTLLYKEEQKKVIRRGPLSRQAYLTSAFSTKRRRSANRRRQRQGRNFAYLRFVSSSCLGIILCLPAAVA